MNVKNSNIDTIWEDKYSQGHVQKYPWDFIVSFIFNNVPRDIPKKQIKILEIGFGTGSNLWSAAREGFSVYGIEGSKSAVKIAQKMFSQDNLSAELKVGDFTDYFPYDNEMFDLVIDRAALCCVGKQNQVGVIREVQRVLKTNGKFYYQGYADNHFSNHSGIESEDGLKVDISDGTLIGCGQLYFPSMEDINYLFQEWKLLQLQKREHLDMLDANDRIHSEWHVIAEKR